MKAKIPSTQEELPRIGMGTYRNFDFKTSSQEASMMTQVLQEFFNSGSRLIDSSPMYGNSEQLVGALSSELNLNQDLFIATKVWIEGREAGISQMKSSISKLGRGKNKIDLMQIHNLVDWKVHLKTLRDWKEKGLIRYTGITHYSNSAFPELEKILKQEPGIDFLQIPYSIGRTEAIKSLIPAAANCGTAVIANEPFSQGAIFRKIRGRALPNLAVELGYNTWAEYFLAFILASKEIQFVIPATSDLAHLRDYLSLMRKTLPTAAQAQQMCLEFSKI